MEHRHHYLARLLEEVDKMEPGLFTPLAPADKGEKVIGKVTCDYLKKVYATAMMSSREVDQLEVELKYTPDPERVPLDKKIDQAKYKKDLLMKVFWACVNNDLGFPHLGIGLREGWEIVELAEQPGDLTRSLMRFLGGVPGGRPE